MKRSIDPNSARWTTYGTCSVLSAPTYLHRSAPAAASRAAPLHLPCAAERVGHVQVDLRPVERALPLADEVFEAPAVERRLQRALGEVPLLVGAELVVGAGRELEATFHPEEVVEVLGVVEAAEDLVLDLLARTEDVRVVLGDDADARQPVERPGELVPVERGRLRVAQRQLAVAPQGRREQPHVPGAVHRLDRVEPVALRDQEHVLRGTSPSGPTAPRAPGRRSAACAPRDSRASRSPAGGRPRARSRSPSPSGARTASPVRSPPGGRGRAAGRALGGRASAPPRAQPGAPRGRPCRRTPSRRSGSAACSSRRRASTRRRGP